MTESRETAGRLEGKESSSLSVVMPNFNHAQFLAEAVEAIVTQSFPPSEVIIVDDGSTDGSKDVALELSHRWPTVRLSSNPSNSGVPVTKNNGLLEATGDYIYFPASKDRVLPGMFEKMMRLLQAHPEAGMCSALTNSFDWDGNDLGRRQTPVVRNTPCFIPPEEAVALMERVDGWFTGNTSIYRRSALEVVSGFDPALGPFADGFVGMVLARRFGACFIPESLAMTRVGGIWSSVVTAADLEKSLPIVERAAELMRTEQAEIFSEKWVREWEGRGISAAVDRATATAVNARRAAAITVLSPVSIPDRAVLFVARLFIGLQLLMIKSWLILRYRRDLLSSPGRLFASIVRKLRPTSRN